MTLTEFLLARIAEDEAAARACARAYPPPWDVYDRGHSAKVQADEPYFPVVVQVEQSEHDADGEWLGDRLTHIARHDPARVLAECEAKRRIVDLHAVDCYVGQGPDGDDDYFCSGGDGAATGPYPADVVCPTLVALVAVYADHPGYREEWRP